MPWFASVMADDFQMPPRRQVISVGCNHQRPSFKHLTMEIPKIKLVPHPETDDAKSAIGYQWNKVAGTRHFIGGSPDNLSKDKYPVCKDCHETMTFYAQIDSIGDKYDLADCMVIQNFVCFNCFNIESLLTQTLAK